MPLVEDHLVPPLVRSNAAQAAVADAALERPALVVGSPPPDGRDLDLLVPDAAVAGLEAALAAEGFARRGAEWVRFAGWRAESLDVLPASAWDLPAGELDRLLADGEPLEDQPRLVRPAPADELLILARRALAVRAPLAAKHRRRIDGVLARDPRAWHTATARAGAWDVTAALAVLRAAHADPDGKAPLRLRAKAAGRGPAALSVLRPERPRGALIALSGIDGSGKSTQAEALARVLDTLGHEAVVDWSRITNDSGLRRLAAPVKTVLAVLERRRGTAPPPEDEQPEWPPPVRPGDTTAQGLRRRFRLLDDAWVAIIALVHARTQRRTLRPHLRAGRVVIRDRYVLDASVQLDEVYGEGRSTGLPGRILRRLCPAPAAAFWIDVDPDTAYARKPEEFTAAELAEHRARYGAAQQLLGVARVDGSRAPDEVCAQLARAAWDRLG